MNFLPKRHTSSGSNHGKRIAGFTLVELLVAMAIFLVVGGSVLALFAQHAPYFARQQNLVGLNISMQNAVSQMQIDLANAGTGYYPGALIASAPVGVTIGNQPSGGGACNVAATFTYTAACFDTLNILTLNPNIPPAHPTDATGGTASTICSDMTASPFYIQPNAGQTPTQTAAEFNTGDQVLLITTGGTTHSILGPTGGNSATASSGTLVNSFVLTGAPIVGANYVALPFNPASGVSVNGGNAYATSDSLKISDPDSTNLGDAFCAADWVMKLEPTTYKIDVSNAQDPTLVRVQNGNTDKIAEQIIGFKVGAATWVSSASTSTLTYSFSSPDYGNNFELVRSVKVTMIGRTNPNPDPTYTFRNLFDGGPYQVLDATVVIDPRNITMNGN